MNRELPGISLHSKIQIQALWVRVGIGYEITWVRVGKVQVGMGTT